MVHLHAKRGGLKLVSGEDYSMNLLGAWDPRVPVTEAEQIVEALRSRRIPVKYIRLEDEGHGIARVENRVGVYAEALKFVEEHLLRG